ncbi:MAG: RNA polymerase subunit sigma [Planctomycetaceae bacterium]
MGGPIVRTGTTPEFWSNWDRVFGGKKGAEPAAAKKAAGKQAPKSAAKKTAPKKAAKKKK